MPRTIDPHSATPLCDRPILAVWRVSRHDDLELVIRTLFACSYHPVDDEMREIIAVADTTACTKLFYFTVLVFSRTIKQPFLGD